MTSRFESSQLEVLPDKAAIAAAVAQKIVSAIKQSSTDFSIALSGGSTPKALYSELVENHAKSVDWNRVRFFWVDERCVPPDDQQSNYKMAFEQLLQPLQIDPQNIFRVRGEDSPEAEATRYAELVRENVRPDANGLPEFDFLLLGMGADGHTASIFPHQMELLESDSVCAVATHPETGQQRVTLTGPTINAARNIVFMITGSAKADVFAQIASRTGSWTTYPTSYIGTENKTERVSYYLDKAAAEKLPS